MKDIDAQITFGDVGVRVGFWDFRDDVCRCKRRMATFVRIERTDADQAMYPFFVHQKTIGVGSPDDERATLDACFLSLHVVRHEHLKPLSLGITGIHTHCLLYTSDAADEEDSV